MENEEINRSICEVVFEKELAVSDTKEEEEEERMLAMPQAKRYELDWIKRKTKEVRLLDQTKTLLNKIMKFSGTERNMFMTIKDVLEEVLGC